MKMKIYRKVEFGGSDRINIYLNDYSIVSLPSDEVIKNLSYMPWPCIEIDKDLVDIILFEINKANQKEYGSKALIFHTLMAIESQIYRNDDPNKHYGFDETPYINTSPQDDVNTIEKVLKELYLAKEELDRFIKNNEEFLESIKEHLNAKNML